MKKLSILVLVCMVLTVALTACGPDAHVHSFSKDWSFNAEQHYHACTCGEKADAVAHVDANNDGACDTCAIIIDNGHVFDTAWTSDASNHWHAALCGHSVVDAKAPHTPNGVGLCTVCGAKVSALTINTVADAIEIALDQDYAAKAGSVFYSHLMYDYDWEEYFTVNNMSYFEKSEGYLHVLNLTEATETWYYAVGDNVWSVFSESGALVANPNEYSADNLTGFYFNGAILDYSEAAQAYGVANLMDALYFLGEDALISMETDIVVNEDGETVYLFNYGIPFWNGIHLVNAGFILDQNNYYISKAYVGVATVEEGNGVDTEYETDEFGEIVYDDNGDPIVKNITLNESMGAIEYTSYYEITQGQKNEIAVSPDKDLISSFKLYDSNGSAVGSTLNVEKGSTAELSIFTNGGNPDLDTINAVVTDADGNETWSVFVNYESGMLYVNAYAEGTYTLTLSSAKYTTTMTLVVTAPSLTEFEVGVYNLSEYDYYAETNVTIPVNGSVDFKALVNSGADSGYTYTISGTGFVVEDGYDYTYVTFSATGTYTVTLTSTADDSMTATLTVVVVDRVIDYDSILNGTYVTVDSMVPITVVFDTASSTLTASANHPRQGEISAVFSYIVADNVFTTTFVSGNSFFQNLYVGSDDKLYIVADFWEYTLGRAPSGDSGDAIAVTGATSYMGDIPVLNNETATYVTTVPAYEYAYFIVEYTGTPFTITITHGTEDILCYSGSPMAPTMVPSGGYITLDEISNRVIIFFESLNEFEDLEVVFTLTFNAI